jgi:hypothetical protein
MPKQATALFADRHSAHAAVEQLVQAGFPRDSISVCMSIETFEREFGLQSPTRSGVRPSRFGGVLGAIVEGLVALSEGGGLSMRAGGPVVSAILRAKDRAAGLCEGLMASGLTEREARHVEEGMRGGALVVGVQAEERTGLALQLLELSGGAALKAA